MTEKRQGYFMLLIGCDIGLYRIVQFQVTSSDLLGYFTSCFTYCKAFTRTHQEMR